MFDLRRLTASDYPFDTVVKLLFPPLFFFILSMYRLAIYFKQTTEEKLLIADNIPLDKKDFKGQLLYVYLQLRIKNKLDNISSTTS